MLKRIYNNFKSLTVKQLLIGLLVQVVIIVLLNAMLYREVIDLHTYSEIYRITYRDKDYYSGMSQVQEGGYIKLTCFYTNEVFEIGEYVVVTYYKDKVKEVKKLYLEDQGDY